jgi:hypothetical protein
MRKSRFTEGQIVTAAGANVVAGAAWRAFDPDGRAYANANAPGDLERLGLTPSGG